jgi:catechol 2,3-dioxygenase-like lactoylglutathione lyase family enzyme
VAEGEGAFRVEAIDHVELFVPDRHAAAAWYERVLGLRVLARHAHWAEAPGGPLMISSDSGRTMLALFEGTPRGDRPTAGFHRVAFRVSRADLDRFLDRLATHPVFDEGGGELRSLAVRDHGGALSIYFFDPFGHRLELTTYQ